MSREPPEERLSGISTVWTVLRQAQAGTADAARAAQQLIVERYRGAVYRYLERVVGDAAVADDLTQEFALGLVRGDYRHADPARGRFRQYVKAILLHLVSKHRRKADRLPPTLSPEHPAWADLADPAAAPDPVFHQIWRDELLTRTWRALGDVHPELAAVLRYRADHPELSSRELADALGQTRGQPRTGAAVRQGLRRARQLFRELLLAEVAHSLDAPGRADVEEELAELKLLDYCRPDPDSQGDSP